METHRWTQLQHELLHAPVREQQRCSPVELLPSRAELDRVEWIEMATLMSSKLVDEDRDKEVEHREAADDHNRVEEHVRLDGPATAEAVLVRLLALPLSACE